MSIDRSIDRSIDGSTNIDRFVYRCIDGSVNGSINRSANRSIEIPAILGSVETANLATILFKRTVVKYFAKRSLDVANHGKRACLTVLYVDGSE